MTRANHSGPRRQRRYRGEAKLHPFRAVLTDATHASVVASLLDVQAEPTATTGAKPMSIRVPRSRCAFSLALRSEIQDGLLLIDFSELELTSLIQERREGVIGLPAWLCTDRGVPMPPPELT